MCLRSARGETVLTGAQNSFVWYELMSSDGGKIMHGPQQVPGGGWIVQAADPQGAAFALVGTRK